MFGHKNIFAAFLSKKRPNKEIEELYNTYRELFFVFAKKHYSIDDSVIKDIYQESFIALCENIRNKLLTPDNLKVSFKTYLFSIGKNKLNNYIRDNHPPMEIPNESNQIYDEQSIDEKEIQEIVRKEVFNLGEPCNRVLMLFYFKRKSMSEIALTMGYKNEQVAKNKRLSCMEQLKKIINKKYKKEDLI